MRFPISRRGQKLTMGLVLTLGFMGVTGCSDTSGAMAESSGNEVADALYYNGKIIALDEENTTFEAIAVSDGKVTDLGTTDEIRKLSGDETLEVDLAGKTIIPGINDSHFHITSYGLSRPPIMLDVGPQNVSSIGEISDLVEEAAKNSEPGEWIQGRGWDQGYLEEQRFPTKEDLDAVSPDNPVILTDWSGHSVWANSKALEIAEVTSQSEAPAGGEIMKDDSGEPSGVFVEGASRLIQSKVPDFTEDDLRTAIITAVDEMHEQGITSVTDGGIGLSTVKMIADLTESGDIRQRITGMVASEPADELRETLQEIKAIDTDVEWLNVDQVKIHLDGVPTQQKTAWVSEEYVGGGEGGLVLSEGTVEEQLTDLQERVSVSHEEGFSVGTHATGDRAIAAAVDAYEEAISANPDQTLRHYIIHGDLIPEETLEKMPDLNIGVNFNPSIKRSLSHQLEEVIGRERADYQWPYRTALDVGVNTASSSDAPVVPPRFLEGITAMLTRESVVSEEVYGAAEAISLEEALRTYTAAGAWQDGAEEWKGTLEEGMVADFVVLDADLEETAPENIVDIEIDATVVGGEVVYSRSDS